MSKLLYIVGPQGSGKSTVARIIEAGWVVERGTVVTIVSADESACLRPQEARARGVKGGLLIIEREQLADADILPGDMVLTLVEAPRARPQGAQS